MGVIFINPYRFGGFSPLQLSPVLWLDASNASSITASSGAVSQWNDLSGNGNHVTNATAASQPTTGTNTRNGLNVIYFDGGDFLKRTSVTGLPLTTGSIFAVFEWPNSVNAGSIVQLRRASNGTPILTLDGFGTDGIFGRRRNDLNSIATTTLSTTRGYQYASMTYDGSNVVYRRNGTQIGSTANSGSTTLDVICIGANPLSPTAEGNFLTGNIAEIVITTSGSSTDRASMETYLATKWGF